MTERPILFSGQMVRAILDTRKTTIPKTQTRRVVKWPEWANPEEDRLALAIALREGKSGLAEYVDGKPRRRMTCPFGAVGDRLWIKETCALYRMRTITKHPDGSPKLCWNSDGDGDPAILYRADMRADEGWTDDDGNVVVRNTRTTLEATDAERWRPSIFMPRWASRINLEVVSRRVERVQDISDADARDEGVECRDFGWYVDEVRHNSPSHAFRSLWDSINAKRGHGWDVNDDVWVGEFRVVT